MKRVRDPKDYIDKARRTLEEAHALLKGGHTEGACNRAYYAMFNAAHFALLMTPGLETADYKTHRGLIADFGKHVILGRTMDPQLGRSINSVRKLRELADYVGDSPPLEDATLAVTEAEAFVAAMKGAFLTEKPAKRKR